jgi:PilZ domain
MVNINIKRRLPANEVYKVMTNTELPQNRRRHERYKAKEGALISPIAGCRKYWKMLDVSMGGASFRHIPCEDLHDFTEIDIAMQDLGFTLEGIPFKVISDCDFTDDCVSFSRLRRCGVEFGPLTHIQESLLDEFIRKYTVPLS